MFQNKKRGLMAHWILDGIVMIYKTQPKTLSVENSRASGMPKGMVSALLSLQCEDCCKM